MPDRILVVDDSASTRKLVKATLEGEGYEVFEAPDGATAMELVAREHPDLVLQDLLLPDIDGFALVRRLRSLVGAEVPILAFTGFLTHLDETRVMEDGFSGFLLKPVEPVRLAQTVRTYLPAVPASAPFGSGKRVLVVDDDPVQRRLMATRLALQGCVVAVAADGMEALEAVRTQPPDAIVSDVLMPRMDGFELCRALRRDPRFAAIPLVLTSAHYTEAADRALAEELGARALVVRTPGLDEVLDVLRDVCRGLHPPDMERAPATPASEHAERVIRQLERQVAMNQTLVQSAALQATQLAILNGVASALTRAADLAQVLDEILYRCLEASSALTFGLIYLVEREGHLALRAQRGAGAIDTTQRESFFGHAHLLKSALHAGEALRVPSPHLEPDIAQELLRRAGTRALLASPIAWGGEPLGALVLGSRHELDEGSTLFARAIGVQVSQALALSRTQADLVAAERRYHDLVEGIDAIVWETDAARLAYSYVSRRAEEVLGYPLSQWLTEPDFWVRHLHADDREATVRAYEASLGRAHASEYRYRAVAANGRTVWLQERVLPVQASEGRSRRVRGLSFDVSERKVLEDQSAHADRIEVMGRLAGGIAHNFNNILTFIAGETQRMAQHYAEGKVLAESIDHVRRATERAAAVTRQLLAFSRQQPTVPRAIDVNEILRSVARMLQSLLGESIQVVVELAPALDPIHADPVQIEQIVLNLALNARDAMPQGGTLTIRTANVVLESDFARRHPGVTPGPHVEVQVRDTGLGIAPETLPHLFEPFFTTKEPGEGTGLGLATVYGTVKQARGTVTVYSELGRGSVFEIFFPRSTEAPIAVPPAPTEPAVRGSETVLFVEDDDDIRGLVEEFLGELGYHMVVAKDGVQALELSATQGVIDLTVTDVVMPAMNGVELARRLRLSRPELEVLFVSGYGEGSLTRQGVIPPGANFLEKPYELDALARQIRTLLDRHDRTAGPPPP